MELRTVETAGEANLRIQLRLAGEMLKRIAFRPIADDQEFERLSLLPQDARSFEQEPHTFRGNGPALKPQESGGTRRGSSVAPLRWFRAHAE